MTREMKRVPTNHLFPLCDNAPISLWQFLALSLHNRAWNWLRNQSCIYRLCRICYVCLLRSSANKRQRQQQRIMKFTMYGSLANVHCDNELDTSSPDEGIMTSIIHTRSERRASQLNITLVTRNKSNYWTFDRLWVSREKCMISKQYVTNFLQKTLSCACWSWSACRWDMYILLTPPGFKSW